MKTKKIAVRALVVLLSILAVAGVALCLSGYPETKTGLMLNHPWIFGMVMLAFATLIMFVGRAWFRVVKELERGPNEAFKEEMANLCRNVVLVLAVVGVLLTVLSMAVYTSVKAEWLFSLMKTGICLIILAILAGIILRPRW